MSYVGEVLKSARNAEFKNLNIKLNALTKNISAFKLEVITMLKKIYVEFEWFVLDDFFTLTIQKKQLTDEMIEAEQRVNSLMEQDVKKIRDDLKRMNTICRELSFEMNVITELITIHEMIKVAEEMSVRDQSVSYAQHLKQMQTLFHTYNENDDFKQLDIYKHLRDEYALLKNRFVISTLDNFNNDVIVWEIIQDKAPNTNKKVSINFQNLHEQRKYCIQNLYLLDCLTREISLFSKNLLNLILKPLLHSVADIAYIELIDKFSIQVHFKPGKPTNAIQLMETYITLFNCLHSFLHFNLDSNADLDNVNQDTSEISYSESESFQSFYTIMGEMVGKEFVDYFVMNYLKKSVPQKKDMNQSQFEQHINDFESVLKHTGFLSSEEHPFSDYREDNFANLIINNTCNSYLDKAREIMKKSLHVMTEVSSKESSELINVTLNRKIADAIQEDDMDSSHCPNLFEFPKCYVSKSTLELMDLTNELLKNICAEENSDFTNKLSITLHNVFMMYCDVVPLHHQKLLETMPQESALLHNNCMYIAHKLCTLVDNYREQLSGSHNNSSVKYDMVFVDSVVMLRNLSEETMNKQLDIQKAYLRDQLKKSGLTYISNEVTLPESVDTSIRQCLCQLSLLQTLWQEILPRPVYCKSMGTLVNTMLHDVIKCMISAHAISSVICQNLIITFGIITTKTSQLFAEEDQSKISRHVRSWNRFQELIKVFNSKSPRDIEDAWNGGKGPLAIVFTAVELKNLIRALIQANERRQALLDKIN